MSIQDLVLNAYLDGIHAHDAGRISYSELFALKQLADAAMLNRSPEMQAIDRPTSRPAWNHGTHLWCISKSSLTIQ